MNLMEFNTFMKRRPSRHNEHDVRCYQAAAGYGYLCEAVNINLRYEETTSCMRLFDIPLLRYEIPRISENTEDGSLFSQVGWGQVDRHTT